MDAFLRENNQAASSVNHFWFMGFKIIESGKKEMLDKKEALTVGQVLHGDPAQPKV